MIESGVKKELNKSEVTKHILNIIAIFITVMLIIFIIYAIKMGVFQDKNKFAQEMKKYGILAPILFLFLQLIQVVFPFIPGGTSCLIGVVSFGPFLGFIYNYVGIVLGSIFAYFLSKKYGLTLIRLFFKEETIQKYRSYIFNDQFKKIFIVGILLPILPDDLLCYMAGISNISFKTFLGSVLIGKFFSVIMYSLFMGLL